MGHAETMRALQDFAERFFESMEILRIAWTGVSDEIATPCGLAMTWANRMRQE
jgi:hypothetical protein